MNAEHLKRCEPPKTCAVCGREMQWRKRWARTWASVKYCSDACRKRKSSTAGGGLEAKILDLLERRAAGATLCPSDVAREAAGPGEDWNALMEPVREAARRLVAKGQLVIMQKGRVVDPSTARGPIRLGRPR